MLVLEERKEEEFGLVVDPGGGSTSGNTVS